MSEQAQEIRDFLEACRERMLPVYPRFIAEWGNKRLYYDDVGWYADVAWNHTIQRRKYNDHEAACLILHAMQAKLDEYLIYIEPKAPDDCGRIGFVAMNRHGDVLCKSGWRTDIEGVLVFPSRPLATLAAYIAKETT